MNRLSKMIWFKWLDSYLQTPQVLYHNHHMDASCDGPVDLWDEDKEISLWVNLKAKQRDFVMDKLEGETHRGNQIHGHRRHAIRVSICYSMCHTGSQAVALSYSINVYSFNHSRCCTWWVFGKKVQVRNSRCSYAPPSGRDML